MKKAVVLINKLSENPSPDELDVLHQVEVAETAIKELGYSSERIFMDMNLDLAQKQINEVQPDLAVNLFEGIIGKPELIYLGSGLLHSLRIPYTGCGVDSIFITADKVLTKKILKDNNIPTAQWFSPKELDLLEPDKTYIIKPLYEDASVGIDEHSVIKGNNLQIIDDYIKRYANNFFIEEFIDGREFNISVLGTKDGAKMLSPAEIIFNNYPDDKPKIMGYTAKWDEQTFEYENTFRTFDFKEDDKKLLDIIEQIVLKCWTVLNLRGYARVDLRIDKNNKPFVLEINANPCISSDSGFYAAAEKSGYSFTEVMQCIIDEAHI